MAFNYRFEKKKFEDNWEKTAAWYRKCGMTESAIAEMKEFDWGIFCQKRNASNHEVPIDDELLDYTVAPDDSGSGRFSWIDTIQNPEILTVVERLSDKDKEMLTMLVIEGYQINEVCEYFRISRYAVYRKIQNIKTKLVMLGVAC